MNMGGWMIKIVNATLSSVIDEDDLKSFQIGACSEHQKAFQFYKDMDWEEVEKFLKMGNPGGSNCIAISGEYTKSGSACLYSDAHLAVLNPSFLFQNRLCCDEFDCTGWVPSGLFGLCIGHNQHISFGMTLAFCDLYELYFEELHPEDENQYVDHVDEDGKAVYREFEKKTNPIRVQGHEDLEYVVRATSRGTIISDIWDNVSLQDHEQKLVPKSGGGLFSFLSDISKDRSTYAFEESFPTFTIPGQEVSAKEEEEEGEGSDDDTDEDDKKKKKKKKYVVSFKSVFTEPPVAGTSITKILEVCTARNYDEFKEVCQNAVVLNLNMVYADKRGSVGYYMTGAIPKRTSEAQKINNMPLPGWQPEVYSWDGYYDHKENPQCFNPKNGFIISCNQEMISQADVKKYNDGMFFGRVYLPSNRARQMSKQVLSRIRQIKEFKPSDEEEENEGEEDKTKKNPYLIDTEFGKFLQRDVHLDEDNSFLSDLAESFSERQTEIEKKRKDQNWSIPSLEEYFDKKESTTTTTDDDNDDDVVVSTDSVLRGEKIHPAHVYGIGDSIANWDFDCTGESIGCTMYSLFELELLHSLLVDGNEFMKENRSIFTKALAGHGIDREFWALNDYWEKSTSILELLLDQKKLENPKTLAYRACSKKYYDHEEEDEDEDDESKEKSVDLDYLLWKVFLRMILRLRKMGEGWVEKPVNSWREEIDGCEYQKFHTVTWSHNLSDLASGLDIGPFPGYGCSKTPCAMSIACDLENMKAIDHPCMRFVVDMADPKKTAAGICPPGISENPCSPHYGDTAAPYMRFEYFKMGCYAFDEFRMNEDDVKEEGVDQEGIIVIEKKFVKKTKKKKKKKKKEEVEEED